MQNKVTLIKTEYYADVIPALINALSNRVNSLDGKNLIFCEEKATLMVENAICSSFKGTFNTDVYSFGKYLKKFAPPFNSISKEGSSMAVKYVLSKSDLGVFSASKTMLAPTLYELIIQLKSAKVTPEAICTASNFLKGALKNKILDVATVFKGYEEFLKEKELLDQGSQLSFLPEILENDKSLQDSDVFIVGYSSFTAQARAVVSTLIKRAKSVTVILTAGDNSVYLNETYFSTKEIASSLNKTVDVIQYKSHAVKESELVLREVFNPILTEEGVETEKVEVFNPSNVYEEIEFIAEQIKKRVLLGEARYFDFTVALSSFSEYSEIISEVFTRLSIPFFIDEKKTAISHPLIRLILSYLTVVQKNMERDALLSFAKNPLIISDRDLSDRFENYVYKYNVNYSRFNSPFKYGEEIEREEAETVRQEVLGYFSEFSVKGLLSKCRAEEKLIHFGEKLSSLKETVDGAINDQVYDFAVKLLDDMEFILKGEKLTAKEIKDLFLSGVLAGEISVLPQYQDAVFVGLYKNTSLILAKYLFAPGLTSAVPAVKEDLALLTDSDINKLTEAGVIVEPKIKHVNKRAIEETAQALASFSKKLYLSFPTHTLKGEPLEKSKILLASEKLFLSKKDFNLDGYYTLKQGLLTYAKDCSDFIDGESNDFTLSASFYKSAKDYLDFSRLERAANREVKIRLDSQRGIIDFSETSPTTLEEFYLCPYKTFLSRGLNLEPRKTGGLDRLFLGVLEHGVLENYVKGVFINNEKVINSRSESDEYVDQIIEKLKETEDFEFLKEDEISGFKLEGAVEEIKEFCFKLKGDLDRSLFKPYQTEVGFGFKGDKNLDAISLSDGKIKLCGKIDRIDRYKDYIRVIDYKTGSISADEKNLFAGRKLQLYLYALALSENKLAGVYYQPVKEGEYSNDKPAKSTMVGKTLGEKESVFAQDLNFEKESKSEVVPVTLKNGELLDALTKEELSSYVAYAKKSGERAAEHMRDGVIVPSPADKICEYCPFTSICDGELFARKIKEVDKNVIIESVKGDRHE